jgi:hypothetical protein
VYDLWDLAALLTDNWMKITSGLTCLLLILLSSFSLMGQDKGGVVRLRVREQKGSPTQTETLVYENSYALLIGNSLYKDPAWPDLTDVPRDIAAVKDVLEKDHGFKTELALDLTREPLLKRIDQFISKYGQRYNSRVLVYFSGHGYTSLLPDGRKMGYLVMTDAPAMPDEQDALRNAPTDEEFERFLPSAITMDEIETYARRFTAKHVLFVFDSCFSGTVLYRSGNGDTPTELTSEELKPVRAYLTAGNETQRVPAFSTFTRKLVAGLEGEADSNHDGYILSSELARWITIEVERDTGRRQTPVFGKSDSFKRGDLIFISPKGSSATSTSSRSVVGGSSSSPALGDSLLEGEISFNYDVNKQLTIGRGEYQITTSWGGRTSNCVYGTSDYNAGVANSRLKDFAAVRDATAYDMSDRVRIICLNEVAVFKNSSDYYAMVQVLQVSQSEHLLSIHYKIIPTKLKATWTKPAYSTPENSGRVTFTYTNNNGKYRIGANDFAFDLSWSSCSSICVYLYSDYIKEIAPVTDQIPIKTAKDASRYPKAIRWIRMTRGAQAVARNSKDKYALVKVIDIKAPFDDSSESEEVVFEYQILPDLDNSRPVPPPVIPGNKSLRVLYSSGVVSGGSKLPSGEVFPLLETFDKLLSSTLEEQGLKVLTRGQLDQQSRAQYITAINSRYTDSNALKSFPVKLFVEPALSMEDLGTDANGQYIAQATGTIEIIATENGKTILSHMILPSRGYGSTKIDARKNALIAAVRGIPSAFFQSIAEKAR